MSNLQNLKIKIINFFYNIVLKLIGGKKNKETDLTFKEALKIELDHQ